MFGFGVMWVYHDPYGNRVGFGTLDVGKDYSQFTNGKVHCYIPLLAVHPAFQKRGHGSSIVDHLTAEAVLIAASPAGISDILFLDVYTANQGAISLYEKCGFLIMNPATPIPDPQENNETYFIMAKRVALISP
jgi:ribosomal protein S18 acetylase RimI-like enzyme